jgi:cellulose synthase (UDP-forming)
MLKNNRNKDLWTFSQARKMSKWDRAVMFVLFVCGIASLVNFGIWWFQPEHIEIPWLFGLLSFFFWYSTIRIPFVWNNYLNIKKPENVAAPSGLKVAIYTTSYNGEPLEMVRKTLEACRLVSYPHKTYLLDNTEDPAFRKAAEDAGAIWLELINVPGAKAGKINRAMQMTDEDFILVLDPDHIPFPNFLDCTLGYFNDPKVGFVQVSQAYYNQNRSFVARASAEQTNSFYGPTQMGYNGLGCAVAIGANCTFRRAAFDSIGGHVVGLAEDLQTSIKLHSAGWKSVYNPVIVSRGIVPEDFGSFCKQQLKWARGTFEVLYVDFPKAFPTLTFWQKNTYLSIATYYLSGFVTFIFTLFPFLFFTTGIMPANMAVSEFVVHGSWIVLFSSLIYMYSQRWMCDTATEQGFHWRAMILKYATWPVFFFGFLLALVKREIPWIPTSKKAEAGFSVFAKPLLAYVLLFSVTLVGIILYRMFLMPISELIISAEKNWVMIGFAFLAFIMSIAGLFAARQPRQKWNNDPWDEIDIHQIKTNN